MYKMHRYSSHDSRKVNECSQAEKFVIHSIQTEANFKQSTFTFDMYNVKCIMHLQTQSRAVGKDTINS